MKIEVMMPVEAQHRESILAGTPTSETSGLTHIDGRKAAKAKSLTADVHQVSEETAIRWSRPGNSRPQSGDGPWIRYERSLWTTPQ
jgi:hypothetical protein